MSIRGKKRHCHFERTSKISIFTNLEKGPAPATTERTVDLPAPWGPMTPTTKKSVWSRST